MEMPPAAPAPAPEDVPAADAPAPEAPAQPKEDDSHRFAILARKQKQLQEREARLKSESLKYADFEKRMAMLKDDPLKFIEEQGIAFDDIVMRAYKKGEPPSVEDKVSSLEAKIAAYEKQIEADKKAAGAQAEQKAIDNFKGDIRQFIEKASDRYEAILAADAFDDVYSVCEQVYRETGELPSIEEAADKVEQAYFEQAQKFSRMKKLAPNLEPQKTDPQSEPTTPSVPTISQKLAPQASAGPELPRDPEERKKAIAIWLQGEMDKRAKG